MFGRGEDRSYGHQVDTPTLGLRDRMGREHVATKTVSSHADDIARLTMPRDGYSKRLTETRTIRRDGGRGSAGRRGGACGGR